MSKIRKLIFHTISGSEASCYFPAAFQGEYVTQSIMSGLPTISYSTLAVLSDSIPVWGTCHRRIGNNVILMDDTGGLTCYKCFNLVLRSSNVLQIHTAGLDKCYTTEERAMADCPSDMMIREQRAREIMLYRKFSCQMTSFLTASKLALEQVLQTTKLFIRICSKFEVNHKGGESHHDANPIAMRILSRCESHCDVNPIAMRIPS